MMDRARQNPIPAVMVGAGVAWILIERTRQRANRRRDGSGWSDYSSPRSRAYGTSAEYTDQYESSGLHAQDEYPRSRSWTGHGRSDSMTRWARNAGNEARQTARRAQNGLQRMINDNPLLVGAAALLIGAVIGASLPETETEHEWMGETRDSVVDRAQETARNAVGAVKEAANDVVGGTVSKVAEKVTGPQEK